MSLNDTPSSERTHIGFFGMRNAGKSSLVNAITGQAVSVVSDIAGTTTDPVRKAMELLPLGPVVIIDTPGFDDIGKLGTLRVETTKKTLNRCDMAILCVDAEKGMTDADRELLELFEEKKIPHITVYTKADVKKADGFSVSVKTGDGIAELKDKMATLIKDEENDKKIVGDILKPNELAVLVIPIDSSAPKGRLILPQQQTVRDILEAGAVAICVRDTEFSETLKKLGTKPALVITDSQVFAKVAKETPKDVLLTSFSILFSRYKGNIAGAIKGAKMLDNIEDGDKILISEGCTHKRQCADIGTVKLPAWIREYTGKNPNFCYTQGRDFEQELSDCKMVIHCGGCMLTEREMKYRAKTAHDLDVPMTNYGIAIAYMNGILHRTLEPFSELLNLL